MSGKSTNVKSAPKKDEGISLVGHAKRELKLIGMYDGDKMEEELADNIIEMIKVWSKTGHSGGSAFWTRDILHKLLGYQNLAPISSNPDEWMEVDDNMWQNKRSYSCFSHDGGKTWYDIDAPKNKWYQFWKWI